MKAFQRTFVGAVLMFVAAANLAVAAEIPMKIDWKVYYGAPAVYGDGKTDAEGGDHRNATYVNGADGQVYLGTGGKNVVLFTYYTGRTLYIDKSINQEPTIWAASGITAEAVSSEVVSYFQTKARYQSLNFGAVAAATGQVEFHYNGNTYTLRYTALAVKKIGTNTWLITSDKNDVTGSNVAPLHKARLSILRNGGHVYFGYVAMPIRFEATILQ